jgi:phospholipid/cholesterol/gamma-HCH transport system permease protein
MLGNAIGATFQTTTRRIVHTGRFVEFAVASLVWLVRDISKPRRWRLLLPQLFEVGTMSLPVILITGGFIGMVFAIELYEQFAMVGQETRLGGVVSLTVVRHVGPVLAAVMLAGRVGGAFSAEIGTMAVTEQIDALKVMAAPPISYLVVPRVLACLIMVPLLTVFSDVIGILGAWAIATGIFEVSNYDFWSFARSFVGIWDISTGLAKSLCFGGTIGLVCCYKGFYCGKGAHGVGRATTDAFVASFVTIIILNFFLAKLSNDLYRIFYGYNDIPLMG